MCMCCSSDPTTFVPSFLFGGYPFIVHWSIPPYHSPKLVPVYFTIRIATLAIISFFIPFQIFIGNDKADFFCLWDDSIYEFLSQLIVCISFYFPFYRVLSVRAISITGPKHHNTWPPPSVQGSLGHFFLLCSSFGKSKHYFISLALVETFFLANSYHCSRIRTI